MRFKKLISAFLAAAFCVSLAGMAFAEKLTKVPTAWMDEHETRIYDQLIMIRESGTWMRPVNNGIVEWDPVNGMPLQCWRVWSKDEEMWTERVTLQEVR